jgi:Plasmid stabilization system protein
MALYIISEEALKDIDNIWLYTAESWSLEQADRYVKFKRLEML